MPALSLVLAAIALLLLHPYQGLQHDARMYTLQALSHLRPALYGNDIFLSMGSQDDYTLFPYLYAWLISILGIEPAAAFMTLSLVAVFFVSYLALSRILLSPAQSWYAFLLLVLLPARYGPGEIFNYIEPFVTPRQLAQALSLFSLLLWIRGTRVTAALFSLCAMAIHPIMGLAAPALVVVFEWALPNWRKPWLPALAASALAVLALSAALPIAGWKFDEEWYEIVIRRNYLLLANWELDDWGRVATVLSTLAIAMSLPSTIQRRIAAAALVTCGGLLLLAFVGGDLFRIVLVVQAQVWRALWLATVLAIALLPPIFVQHWHRSPWARSTLVFLGAAWVSNDSTALGLAALALLTSLPAMEERFLRHARSLQLASWAGLGMVVLLNLADAHLYLAADLSSLRNVPESVDRLAGVSHNGTLPGIVAASIMLAVSRGRSQRLLPALVASGSVVLFLLLGTMSGGWTKELYSGATYEAFSEWRARIPQGREVLWLLSEDRIEEPATSVWLLLERPSFLSGTQAPNALFSREAALEMRDRARSLHGLLPVFDPFAPQGMQPPRPLGPLSLDPVCRLTKVRYVVTTRTLVDAVPVPAPISVRPSLRNHKLYICP